MDLGRRGKGDGDKVESDQGILAHRLCDYSPAIQLKAGPFTRSGDRALVQSSRTDSSGVIANGKPPPTLQTGTLELTHSLSWPVHWVVSMNPWRTRFFTAAWGLAESPTCNRYC